MEKVCRKYAVKTSTRPIFNFRKLPLTNLLHPDPLYGQNYEKQEKPE